MRTFFEWVQVLCESEEDNLIAGVQARPLDPIQWNIFADYLEEGGDQRRSDAARVIARHLPTIATWDEESVRDMVDEILGLRPHRGGAQPRQSLRQRRMLVMSMFPQAIEALANQGEQVRYALLGTIHGDELEECLMTYAHGSGLDADWDVDIGDAHYTATTAYHVMDGNGYYTGWVGVTLTVPKLDPRSNTVQIDANDVAGIEAQYANDNEEGEEEGDWMDDNGAPYMDDLDDHIGQTVDMALQYYTGEGEPPWGV